MSLPWIKGTKMFQWKWHKSKKQKVRGSIPNSNYHKVSILGNGFKSSYLLRLSSLLSAETLKRGPESIVSISQWVQLVKLFILLFLYWLYKNDTNLKCQYQPMISTSQKRVASLCSPIKLFPLNRHFLFGISFVSPPFAGFRRGFICPLIFVPTLFCSFCQLLSSGFKEPHDNSSVDKAVF